jgi:hypothetical protein
MLLHHCLGQANEARSGVTPTLPKRNQSPERSDQVFWHLAFDAIDRAVNVGAFPFALGKLFFSSPTTGKFSSTQPPRSPIC